MMGVLSDDYEPVLNKSAKKVNEFIEQLSTYGEYPRWIP